MAATIAVAASYTITRDMISPQISCEARTVTRQALCGRASNIRPSSASDVFATDAMELEASRIRLAMLIRERESAASARIEAELTRMRRK